MPFRPLIFLAVIATATLTLVQVEAMSVPDVSVLPAPPRVAAPTLPSPVPDGATSVAVEPAPVPAARTAAAAPTGSTPPDPPASTAGAPIEGLDLVEVFLRISGTLTTAPVATEAAAALTAPISAPAPPPAAAATAPVTRPSTITPGAQVAPSTGPLQPSVFERAQVVSFYGYPGVGVMGELGLHTPTGAAEAITRLAAEYDALNGPREVLPALHLIVAVAQRHPGNSGLYLQRMGDELLSEYVEAARAANILLFVDVQIGWSDALTEVKLLEDVLREPFVHLALDPEFATKGKGTAPGVAIGTLGSADLNAVQHYLAGLVREHDLPPKVLVVHQFLNSMLTGTDDYDDVAEVDVTIDMDGFGSPYVKLVKYDLYATADYAERAAIKLFYHWDAPVMTPARLLSLDNPPDLVIYQ